MTAKTFFLKVKAADTNQYLKSSWLQACVRHVFLINHFPSKMWKKSHSSQFGFKMRNRSKSVHSFCLNTHRTAASGTAWPSTCSISGLFTSFSVDWRQHTATAECCHILFSIRRQKTPTAYKDKHSLHKPRKRLRRKTAIKASVKVKLCVCVCKAGSCKRVSKTQESWGPVLQTWAVLDLMLSYYRIFFPDIAIACYKLSNDCHTLKKKNYPCNFISCIMLVLVRFWSFW